jgi:hypothetical protein
VTVWQLIKHLLTAYGRITPSSLSANDARMRAAFDADQPIEVLFTQIEDGMDYAAAGNGAYSLQQIIIIAYSLIFASDAYPEACREWRKKSEVDKNWENFKTEFASAYHDRCEATTTSQRSGYHDANSTTREVMTTSNQTIVNLAAAAAADRETMANLALTNTTLSQQLAASQEENALLKRQLDNLRNQRRAPGGAPGRQNYTQRGAPFTPKNFNNTNYCWTHGWKCDTTHTSRTCTKPRVGHQLGATRADTMGGSDANKPV